jgi:hypothetical protein
VASYLGLRKAREQPESAVNPRYKNTEKKYA